MAKRRTRTPSSPEVPGRITARGVRPDLWRRLRGQSAYRGLSVGDLLNQILHEWLALHEHEITGGAPPG